MLRVQVVGVDPFGSTLAQPESLNETTVGGYEIEGIGYDFIPRVLDRSVIDRWEKTMDQESFLMSRRLIREVCLHSTVTVARSHR